MPRVCPRCGELVPDGSEACPRCRASAEVTQRMSLDDLTWCPSCGALVPPGDDVCPRCGTPVRAEAPRRAMRSLELPEIDEGEDGADEAGAARTGIMTRIESAIPPADGEASPSAVRDRMPRPRVFALAALLAVVLVGGATLLITHPWDPSASNTRASEPADTSMSGFPGLVESLTGQDASESENGEGRDEPAPDAFEQIESAYAQLAELEQDVEKSEDALRQACEDGDDAALEDGLEAAQATSISVSNLISDSSVLDDEDGAYAEDLEHLQTLGSWLRNRCDILTAAWERAADAPSFSDVADSVAASLDAASDYARLFDENYDEWKPVRAE